MRERGGRDLRLLSTSESDSIEDKVDQFKLFLSPDENNRKGGAVLPYELLSQLAKISASGRSIELMKYAFRVRAFTALMAQSDMEDMAEATFYRCVKRLIKHGFVVKIMKVYRGPVGRRGKGGPLPTIFGVPNYKPDDVAEALQHHNRLKSPKYREAHKVTQLVLEEYIDMEAKKPEIRYAEIMEILKSRLSVVQPDIADLVASDLHRQGIKVWR